MSAVPRAAIRRSTGSRPQGKIIKRLTVSPAIEISPSWAPGGRDLVFTSDRTGTPQLYIIDSDGAGRRRLTFEGRYNDSAGLVARRRPDRLRHPGGQLHPDRGDEVHRRGPAGPDRRAVAQLRRSRAGLRTVGTSCSPRTAAGSSSSTCTTSSRTRSVS